MTYWDAFVLSKSILQQSILPQTAKTKYILKIEFNEQLVGQFPTMNMKRDPMMLLSPVFLKELRLVGII